MAQLRQDYQKFVDRNAEIITIGPEDANAFTKWWNEHQMPFIGIPDPKHDVAKLYNQEFKLLRGGRLPALAVIDLDGKIRLMHYADLPSDIPSDEEVLSLLDNLNKETASGHPLTVAQPTSLASPLQTYNKDQSNRQA
jgi:peroxiredoxin Q/BCP